MDVFAPFYKINGCFVVFNICKQIGKTIRIFNYPIPYGQTRDLLQIPGVAEADIRASLLKGELQHKIRYEDIVIICSDIDLLQFNDAQLAFLQSAGITKGLTVNSGSISYLWRQYIVLLGATDGVNRVFMTPDTFIQGMYHGNLFQAKIFYRGRQQVLGIDYTLSLTGSPGPGFNTITFKSFTPRSSVTDVLYADYVVIAP